MMPLIGSQQQQKGPPLTCRRVVFQPYTRQQLETIASSRVDGLDCFEKRAIEYAARKVRNMCSRECTLLVAMLAAYL